MLRALEARIPNDACTTDLCQEQHCISESRNLSFLERASSYFTQVSISRQPYSDGKAIGHKINSIVLHVLHPYANL